MSLKTTIKYAYFVDNVSRKFTLRKNTCSPSKTVGPYDTEPMRYMGGAVRQDARFGIGLVQKNFMFLRFNPRSSAVSSDETLARLAFGTASKLAKAWKANLTTMQAITTAWKADDNGTASGVAKKGYTFFGWIFAVAYQVVQGGGSASSEWPGYVPAV